jgi:hypothetical protein
MSDQVALPLMADEEELEPPPPHPAIVKKRKHARIKAATLYRIFISPFLSLFIFNNVFSE